MDKKLIQENFEERLKEVLAFAKEKEISIRAVQKLNQETGYIGIIPLYSDLKKYVKDVEFTSEPSGTNA